MVNELAQYMQDQIAKGYSKEQVVQYLEQQNYSQKNIKNALSELENNQLKIYINNMLQQGYDSNQLYAQLLDQDYDKKKLKKIFIQLDKEFYGGKLTLKEIHEKHSVSIKLIGILLLMLLLVGGSYFVYDNMVSKLDSYNQPKPNSLTPKNELNKQPNEIIKTTSTNSSINNLENKKTLVIKSNADDDMFTNAINEQNKDRAEKNCEYIKDDFMRNECYVYLSEKFNDKTVCEKVDDQFRYDDCYIYFILNGDKLACKKLKLPENNIFC